MLKSSIISKNGEVTIDLSPLNQLLVCIGHQSIEQIPWNHDYIRRHKGYGDEIEYKLTKCTTPKSILAYE